MKMKTIKIKDLEIIEQEKQLEELSGKTTATAMAQLSVENKKKDALIQQLTKTTAELSVELAKVKGAIGYV